MRLASGRGGNPEWGIFGFDLVVLLATIIIIEFLAFLLLFIKINIRTTPSPHSLSFD